MSAPLFACSRCFSRHPFEDLSAGQQLCKECRGAFPVVKCTYCRSEFQQTTKGSTSTICKKCEQNVKAYGKPTACEYCNIIAAFIGNKCQRCTNSEIKYGPPVNCEQCKQKCAFDRHDDDKKVDGKLLCWLCTLSFKRALARTKQGDVDRIAHMKMSQMHKNKHGSSKDQKLRSHNKRPHRVDVTKMPPNDSDNGMPSSKMSRTSSGTSAGSGGSGSGTGGGVNAGGGAAAGGGGGGGAPGMIRTDLDPNSSDHVVAMTQLKEKIASLQKQLSIKDNQMLNKDKMITELKAKHFTTEAELRVKMQKTQKEYEVKVETMSGRISSLLKEVASLSKSLKKNRFVSANTATAAADNSNNSGSGTDSPSLP